MKMRGILAAALVFVLAVSFAAGDVQGAIVCGREVTADVAVIDQPVLFNRLGASNVNGMIYALEQDVVTMNPVCSDGTDPVGGACTAPATLIEAMTPIRQTGLPPTAFAGNAMLRPDKRPRPLVLRVRRGDCLTVTLSNLLTPAANLNNVMPPQFNVFIDEQVLDRNVSFHAAGMQYVNGPNQDDGANIGANGNSTVAQGQSNAASPYKLYAEREGAFQVTSLGSTVGSDANQGNAANLLFGEVIVEPTGARIYRSGVTEEEMRLASMDLDPASSTCGSRNLTLGGHPVIDYEARYPTANCNDIGVGGTGVSLGAAVWAAEGKAGLPILNMMDPDGTTTGSVPNVEIVHTALDAIVAGPEPDGRFPASTYPLESVGKRNPTLPNRLEPFRDFASIFHDEPAAAQAFPGFYKSAAAGGSDVFRYVLEGVKDGFMINYGSGGIGSEILANRLRVGPMHDCLTCAYEEFFLTSFTVGDPAMLTDVAANFGLEECRPITNGRGQVTLQNCPATAQGPKANYVPYPDDVANVHHSYTGDFAKIRNIHVGQEQHVFHLHNHQWLYNPNDDNSNYLDAQGIGPGVGYTYEINFGGSGNRNKTSGDSIFHCHFYPHFAQGMWYHWRHHDVLETGTILAASGTPTGFHAVPWALENGTPMLAATAGLTPAADGARVRAIPDGEVAVGAPIAALVPLPGKAMAPMPGEVQIVPNVLMTAAGMGNAAGAGAMVPVGSLARVVRPLTVNPGYPFWVAGIEDVVGQRPPTPPLDMLTHERAVTLRDSGNPLWANLDPDQADGFDGGLPRAALQGYASGGDTEHNVISPIDFTKVIGKARAVFYPEEGTDVEQMAMSYHAIRNHSSYKVNMDGSPPSVADFVLNGSPPSVGAPYNEPCIDDDGNRMESSDGSQYHFFSGESAGNPKNVHGSSIFNASTPRIYKGANIQFDAVINKVGYHYPQQRIISLWQDAVPVITKEKAGQPLVLRLNTFDCAIYHHTNLVPEVYEIDDYQVRTPTDIIGQHIHLPKWDLTTADGSANGWNYEDGTMSPGAVRERIHALNNFVTLPGNSHTVGSGWTTGAVPAEFAAGTAEPLAHPYFGTVAPAQLAPLWVGARTTTQRWFADPVVNTEGVDRGLGIIFTHDHYGPSTHQQIGLYATVLAEPAGSAWVHNETGEPTGYDVTDGTPRRTFAYADGRVVSDGGPTAWQAAILPPETAPNGSTVGSETLEPFREFYFEYSDFQHAYEAGVYVGADQYGRPTGGILTVGLGDPIFNAANPDFNNNPADAFRFAINPPARQEILPVFPDLVLEVATTNGQLVNFCPERPCPQAIDVQDPGVHVVNYRNEPVGLRIYDPAKMGPDGRPGMQADGPAGDLAFALSSNVAKDSAGNFVPRRIPELNMQPLPGSNINGTVFPPAVNSGLLEPGDPFTPTLRTYAGDLIRVKMQAGGHEEEHNATIHGVKWLQTGSGHGKSGNSGWRNAQAGGISEQFTLSMPVVPGQGQGGASDYLYSMDASNDGYWSGMWGLLRSYNNVRPDLFMLDTTIAPTNIANLKDFNGICPKKTPDGGNTPVRAYDITAVLANDVLPAKAGVIIQDLTLDTNPVSPTFGLPTGHAGNWALNPAGGTLVYNPRVGPLGQGPIHDPTAILYVRTADIDPVTGKLFPNVKVEPLVLRAAAGDCIEVTLRNALPPHVEIPLLDLAGVPVTTTVTNPDGTVTVVPVTVTDSTMPDLATYSTIQGVVKRDRGIAGGVVTNPFGATTFQTNLVRPSGYVGLHPQLVAYDVTAADGTVVGINPLGLGKSGVINPTTVGKFRWYAGDITATRVQQGKNTKFNLVATPVEFGGSNLMPSDMVKQGAKSLVGALVIEPRGATWNEDTDDATGRQTATVTVNGTTFRDFSAVFTKALTQYYADSSPVEHINGEGVGIPEDSQDATGMAINYGIEPLWFRAGIPPQSDFGNLGFGGIDPQHDLFSNAKVGGDPATPVFLADSTTPFRMRVTNPYGTSRGTTFQLHGHLWPRDPYICPGIKDDIPGRCATTVVGSQKIGENLQSFFQGGQESITPATHFDIVPTQTGSPGDYLFRDSASIGNASGLWGIIRVQ